MKKSLIALAVLATAGAASAQSSVTLFGVVDAALSHGTGKGVGSSSRTQLVSGAYNTSRLGFRGTEDLGGGMSASFWLEAGLNNDSGMGFATNATNQGAAAALGNGQQGLTFNRRSTVSLSGGWGEVRLGRDYTPHFWNLSVFDPFGSVGVGVAQNYFASGGGGGLGGPTNTRASNSFGYFLPGNLGGFYGQIQGYLGENLRTVGATRRDGDGGSVRGGYANGPVNVAIAYGVTRFRTGDIKTTNIGGQYDFGVARVMANYGRDRVSGVATGKGGLIGGLVPVGAGEIRLSYSQYRVDSATNPKMRKLALGYVHNLSRRTALYATYARVRNSGGAALALAGATTAAGSSSNGYDFGIRHSF